MRALRMSRWKGYSTIEASESGRDRRGYPRVNAGWPCLLVAKASQSLGALIGVTENIGRRGVLIRWQPEVPLEAPKLGDELAVAVEWPLGRGGGARYVRCLGRVVRAAAAAAGEQPLVAIEFRRMNFWRAARIRLGTRAADISRYGAQKGGDPAGRAAQAGLWAATSPQEGGKLTKPLLAEELARVLEIPRPEAALVLEAILESIVGALRRGERVQIGGFGRFSTRLRRGRMARNPRTGAPVEVPPRWVLYFRAGKALQEVLNAVAREPVLG
jgi:integration host factor subunit beta